MNIYKFYDQMYAVNVYNDQKICHKGEHQGMAVYLKTKDSKRRKSWKEKTAKRKKKFKIMERLIQKWINRELIVELNKFEARTVERKAQLI